MAFTVPNVCLQEIKSFTSMKDPKLFFHRISYLQYPLLVVGLFYCYKPFFDASELFWVDINKGLVFFGLGISISTLQDTRKTQNKMSRRIFENARYTKIFLVVLVLQIFLFTGIGLLGMFGTERKPLTELSFGFISVGIGLIGLLKGAVEIAENLAKSPVK
jgi:hypothetical protein